MHTRYDKKQRRRDGSLTALRLLACLVLLGLVSLMRVFFPSGVDAMREIVLPRMEQSFDYRGAITAIGESLAGDTPLLEVLGDMAIRAFQGEPADEGVEVQAVPEAVRPRPATRPEKLAEIDHPPIEQVIYIPMPDLPWLYAEPEELPEVEIEIETPAAVAAFHARQEAFYGQVLPARVSLSYYPLPIAHTSPLYGPVSSGFGFRHHPLLGEVRFHFGTDIAVYTGVPFVAFADGRVAEAGNCESFGLYILLDHGYGIYTRYAHASALYVQAGDVVERGAMIGRVGQTGGATGPHLHFELLVDGQFRNPEFYIQF